MRLCFRDATGKITNSRIEAASGQRRVGGGVPVDGEQVVSIASRLTLDIFHRPEDL